MCCHLVLGDVCLFLSIIHIFIGIIYSILAVEIIGSLIIGESFIPSNTTLGNNSLLGIEYSIYFISFTLLGFIIFVSIKKEKERTLGFGTLSLFIAQCYVTGLGIYYNKLFPLRDDNGNFSRLFTALLPIQCTWDQVFLCQISATWIATTFYIIILLLNLRKLVGKREAQENEDDNDNTSSMYYVGYSNLC